MTFRDSVGNTYRSLPPKKPNPSAKPSKSGARKYNRNRDKCARYALEGRREKNKARRVAKDAKRQRPKADEQVAA
jgi:hypothetical protein